VVAAVRTTETAAHHATVGPFTHAVMSAGLEPTRHGRMSVLHHEAVDGDEAMFLTIIETLIERTRSLGQILQCCSKLRDRIGAALRQRYDGVLDRVFSYMPYLPGPLDDTWRAIVAAVQA